MGGIAMNVGDYVRYPNPTAGGFPAMLIGVITGINAGAGTFNATYLTTTGTTGTSTNVTATTATQLAQASGPANAECVARP